jgi:phage host-nuclease inhibitor protein Gam
VKAKNAPGALKSWNDVETELGVLANAGAERKRIKAKYESQLAALRASMDQETNDLDFQVDQSTSNIIGFVNVHKEEEGKKKKVFNTGTVSWKDIKTYEYPKDAELVELLKQLGKKDLIDTKEKPDKSAIRAQAKKNSDIYRQLGIEVGDELSVKIDTY